MPTTNAWAGTWLVQSGAVNSNLSPEAPGGTTTFTTAVSADITTGKPILTFTTSSTKSVWSGKIIWLPASGSSVTDSVSDSVIDTVGTTDKHRFTIVIDSGVTPKSLTCCLEAGVGIVDGTGGSWTAHDQQQPGPPSGDRHRRHRKPRYSKPQEPQAEA
jgi:hypothetical protein